jgi:acyl carrier protein
MSLVHDEITGAVTFSDTTILGIVKTIVSTELGIEEEEVTLDAKFVEDLGADSLNLVDMVMHLEEVLQEKGFALHINDEEAEHLECAGAVVEYLRKKGFTDHCKG